MPKSRRNESQKYLKVVYFDEDTASDFLDMKLGGKITQEDSKVAERNADVAARAGAEAGAKFKWLNLFSIGADISVDSGIGSSTRSLLSKTLSNTILTDYLDGIDGREGLTTLSGLSVYPVPNSLTHVKMFAPYINLINSDGQPLNLSQMDKILASAKGYYEMIGERGKNVKFVLRFNLNAFRNNYGLPDLPRMDLEYHGIQVGTTTEANLDAESELYPSNTRVRPTASEIVDGDTVEQSKQLAVYDVVFAGVRASE